MAEILDFNRALQKKQGADDLARGRQPLYKTHLPSQEEDFGDRVQRIRSSLEKINRLMSELKKLSENNRG